MQKSQKSSPDISIMICTCSSDGKKPVFLQKGISALFFISGHRNGTDASGAFRIQCKQKSTLFRSCSFLLKQLPAGTDSGLT